MQMKPIPSIDLRWVTSAEDIPEAEWDRCFPRDVEGRWWYLALGKSGLEDQFKFGYALLESDGELVGIAPIFICDVPMDLVAPPMIVKVLRFAGKVIRGLRYQRTLFVGSPCA